jgi:hypothetical protein
VTCLSSVYLYFSSTSFKGDLPQFPPGIIEIDASNTLIDGGLVGENFAGLNSLNWLLLDGNQFDSSIPTEIAALPSLEYFYAANAMITGDLSYMQNMPAIFEHWVDHNPNLVSFYICLGDLYCSLRSFYGTVSHSFSIFHQYYSKGNFLLLLATFRLSLHFR